jgi:hypothetical protein
MATVIFTSREMTRAWRTNLEASASMQISGRSNAHRLLLFYAVECGLKAALMKRRFVACTNLCEEIDKAQHNINRLLDCLNAGQDLRLPEPLNMMPIKDKASKQERKLHSGQINQMWRYGGSVDTSYGAVTSDKTLEDNLLKISEWIQGELTGV